jgi:hypothetical protein
MYLIEDEQEQCWDQLGSKENEIELSKGKMGRKTSKVRRLTLLYVA